MTAVSVLRRDRPEVEAAFTALASVWVRGVEVDWGTLFEGSGAQCVALPTYAFQRERYWLQDEGMDVRGIAGIGQVAAEHPLLGAAVALAGDGGWLFTGRLSVDTHRWLADHAVMGVVLLPGTALLELALRAGREIGCQLVRELVLEAPLVLPEHGGVQVQVSVGEPDETGASPVGIYSRREQTSDAEPVQGDEWTCHASGLLAADIGSRPAVGRADVRGGVAVFAEGAWPPAGAEAVDVDDVYDRLAGLGLEYGPGFQGLSAAWRRGEEVFAEVALAETEQAHAGSFGLHPALLDAALHAIGAGLAGAGGAQLPFSWSGVRLHARGASSLRVHLSASGEAGVSLALADAEGGLVALVDSLALRPVSREQLGGRPESLFCLEWVGAPVADSAVALCVDELSPNRCAVLGVDGSGVVEVLRAVGVGGVYAGLQVLDEGVQTPEVVFLDCTPGDAGVLSWCMRLPTGCWVSCRRGSRRSGLLGLGSLC